MNIISFHEILEKDLLYEADSNEREIDIYKLDNVILSGHSLYYPEVLIKPLNNYVINEKKYEYVLPYYETTMSLKKGTRYESEGMTFESSKSFIKKQEITTPVFFFIYNSDNYFHFLYDTLPYLISFFHLRNQLGACDSWVNHGNHVNHGNQIKNLKLLMNYPNPAKTEFYRFVTEFLMLLGLTEDDIILADSDTVYSTIYLSSSFTHNGLSNLPPRKEIYTFYNSLIEKATRIYNQNHQEVQENKRFERIYISRRTWIHNDLSNIGTNYTTRRMMMNEDELVKLLTMKYNFTEVFTENLNTIEKILLFKNARIIIGAIGGGIANALFSEKETRLIAILSPCFIEINERFKYSLENTQVYYFDKTHLSESLNGFSKYMRVRHKACNLIGEITELRSDSVIVAINHSHGWNSEMEYEKEEFLHKEISKLDNGLNSPYRIEIEELDRLLEFIIAN